MNELEKALVAMSPAPSRLDRDALMYSAGRAVAPRRRLWPTLACGFAVISMALSLHAVMREPQIVEKTVLVHEGAPFKPAEAPSGGPASYGQFEDFGWPIQSPYLELERQTLRHGDLPMSYPPSAAPLGSSAWPSIEKELDLPPERLRGVNQPSSPF
jgi:hypothetical protein